MIWYNNYMQPTIAKIKQEIVPILRRHHIQRASLFGSIVHGNMHEGSDVDVLVELPEEYSLYDMLGVKIELEEYIGRKVDLVEYNCIKEKLKKGILSSQVPIIS